MASPAYYLRATTTGYSLHAPPGSTPGTPAPGSYPGTPEKLPGVGALDERGVLEALAKSDAAQVVVGVPASWCLCAQVSEEGLPQRRGALRGHSGGALDFRLESRLPMTAERCAIDYVGPGPEYLGVALEASKIKSLIHALEDEGHSVEAIAPRAMLAAQAWLDGQMPDATDRPTSFFWLEEDATADRTRYQLIHLDPATPPRWRISPSANPQNLHQQLDLDEIDAGPTQRQWHAPPECQGLLTEACGGALNIKPLTSTLEAEIDAAHKLIAGTYKPWINLGQGPLAPRYHWRRLRLPVGASVAAMVVLLLSILAVLWFRADQYTQITRDYDQQSAQAFVEALPGQVVPTSPQRRLQARLKQLRGESGLAAGDQLTDTHAPTLVLLHNLLDALPSDQRYAVTDLRIEDGQLRMTGYARSHGETDQLANALRQASRFTVEPPSTDNLPEGGVRFTLKATHPGTPGSTPGSDRGNVPTPRGTVGILPDIPGAGAGALQGEVSR